MLTAEFQREIKWPEANATNPSKVLEADALFRDAAADMYSGSIWAVEVIVEVVKAKEDQRNSLNLESSISTTFQDVSTGEREW